jgi:hypothetical protein
VGLLAVPIIAPIGGGYLRKRDDRESAIVATLPPGSYTVIVSGKIGSVGVGLVEVYHIEWNASASESESLEKTFTPPILFERMPSRARAENRVSSSS